jgi:ethanolamine utilization protein EutM
MKSLGFIEMQSVTAAIEALDTMCKAADVELVTWERKLGGRLVTVIIQGEVAAVTEAINAAVAGAMKSPCIHAVIANPHEETRRMVDLSASKFDFYQSADGTKRDGTVKDHGNSKKDDRYISEV